MIALDRKWLAANPLEMPASDSDKNSRGRVLAIGGALQVPGALRLTAEAAFRAGAGKVQIGTVDPAALPLGVMFPEVATHGLAMNAVGELDARAAQQITALLEYSDALVIGPGMSAGADGFEILDTLLRARPALPLLLDAAMLHVLPAHEASVRDYPGACVLTPHPGEMAALMNVDVSALCAELAQDAASRFEATVVLKGPTSWIAEPGTETLCYEGGGPGLATGGSGDVLAGVIAGLLARGINARLAAAWGVWAHGEAGAQLAQQIATTGFLARELLPRLPALLY